MSLSDAADELIVEGILVSVDAEGRPNIAPMGPRVDRALRRFILRPYQTAQTYRNLKATGRAVFHITDDVLLLAQAAIGHLPPTPLAIVEGFACPRLSDACRWFALRLATLDDSSERTQIECRLEREGEIRPFFGFNRAKHAVLEAAILATRVGLLAREEIQDALARLESSVEKTAGVQERTAFALLQRYIGEQLP